MRLSRVRRRCGLAAYGVFEDQVDRLGDVVQRRVPLVFAEGGQVPAVRFELVDQQRQVGALLVRQLARVDLAEFFQPLVGERQLLGARGRVGMVRLAAPSYLPTAIAPSGSMRHSAVRNCMLAVLKRRSCALSFDAGCALRRQRRAATRAAGLRPSFATGALALACLALDGLGHLGLALLFRLGGAGRRQREGRQQDSQRDFRFHHRDRPRKYMRRGQCWRTRATGRQISINRQAGSPVL